MFELKYLVWIVNNSNKWWQINFLLDGNAVRRAGRTRQVVEDGGSILPIRAVR
jgi:hypothetical protein